MINKASQWKGMEHRIECGQAMGLFFGQDQTDARARAIYANA